MEYVAALPLTCHGFFANATQEQTSIDRFADSLAILRRYQENPRRFLQDLEPPDGNIIKPNAIFDARPSAHVFQVGLGDGTYALKAFTRYTGTRISAEDGYNFELGETSVAIAIQQALARLGMAPKVLGVMSAPAMEEWRNSQSMLLDQIYTRQGKRQAYFRFGLLMEAVHGVNLKDAYVTRNFTMTASAIARARVRAREIDEALIQLSIAPLDFEFLLNPNGDLMLIDLAYYRLEPRTLNPRSLPWEVSAVSRLEGFLQSAVTVVP